MLALAFTFFVIVLSKTLLGLVVCWMLMPCDDVCPTCDARLLPLAPERGRRLLYRVFALQRRWCMECGNEMLGRRGRPVPLRARAQTPEVTTRWSQ